MRVLEEHELLLVAGGEMQDQENNAVGGGGSGGGGAGGGDGGGAHLPTAGEALSCAGATASAYGAYRSGQGGGAAALNVTASCGPLLMNTITVVGQSLSSTFSGPSTPPPGTVMEGRVIPQTPAQAPQSVSAPVGSNKFPHGY